MLHFTVTDRVHKLFFQLLLNMATQPVCNLSPSDCLVHLLHVIKQACPLKRACPC
jgi:hypothetical protein